MKRYIHAAAGTAALTLVAGFWLATAVSELFLSAQAIVAVKRSILYGMALLIPAAIAAGASGFLLSRTRDGAIVERKKGRMRLIALNGVLVLLPSALFLYAKAAEAAFDGAFQAVQALELAAGAVQFVFLGLNIRDGMRLRRRAAQPPSESICSSSRMST